jgi:hypothetical protein
MLNLTLAFMKDNDERPYSWVDLCIELADQVMHWTERRGLKVEPITIEPLDGKYLFSPVGEGWALHQVILCGGKVHDMYVEEPIALGPYLEVMFPGQRLRVEYPDRDPVGLHELTKPVAIYDIWKDGVLELRVDTDSLPAVA